jgi:tRNA (guanine37-N1)-methyltransferase
VRFTVLTLFPGLFTGFLESSILARAIARGLVGVRLVDIRVYATDRHHVCDDAAYGGGPGMVMKAEPIAAALEAAAAPGRRVVYLTPAGRRFTQREAEALAKEEELTLLCGRYEGIDERVIETFVTDELSIGDYVLSGGEVAAMAVVDAVSRLVPGVITGESLEEESFAAGLLEYPHYTRPEVFRGLRVPEVLLSGHHEKIRQWRLLKSIEKTMKNRPDLLESDGLPAETRELLRSLENPRDTAAGKEGDGHGRDEGA